jgi:hypothetical protein
VLKASDLPNIGWCLQNNYRDIELWQILLKRQVAIDRDENIKLCIMQGKKLTILYSCPPICGTVFTS